MRCVAFAVVHFAVSASRARTYKQLVGMPQGAVRR
jgi:hypothetical protein